MAAILCDRGDGFAGICVVFHSVSRARSHDEKPGAVLRRRWISFRSASPGTFDVGKLDDSAMASKRAEVTDEIISLAIDKPQAVTPSAPGFAGGCSSMRCRVRFSPRGRS